MSFHYSDKSQQDLIEKIKASNLLSMRLCSKIMYSPNSQQLRLCNYYLRLSAALRKMGYEGDDWKISLYSCDGDRDYGIESQQDLEVFDFTENNHGRKSIKPYGLWFSNFYELILGDNGVRPSNSWIKWCIGEMPEWAEPTGCDFLILARFNKPKLIDLKYQKQGKRTNPEVNWGHIASVYSGVSAGWGKNDQDYPLPSSGVSGAWEVPSWVAWKHDAFLEVHLIRFEDINANIFSISPQTFRMLED